MQVHNYITIGLSSFNQRYVYNHILSHLYAPSLVRYLSGSAGAEKG